SEANREERGPSASLVLAGHKARFSFAKSRDVSKTVGQVARLLQTICADRRAESLVKRGLPTAVSTSMADRREATQFDPGHGKGKRYGGERDQHEHPEGVHIGEERCLRLDLLTDPINGPLMRLGKGVAVRGEIARHVLQRVLVLDAGGDCMLGKPALMELLA